MAKISFSDEEKRIEGIISKIEKEWPEMTKEFQAIQQEQYRLFCIKQNDYGLT